MSPITAKALLHFEQSRCLERQDYGLIDGDLESLTNEDYDDVIAEKILPIQKTDLFEVIQRLDSRLYIHVANKDYVKALKSASKMRKRAPESYYGYHRAAQINLIQNQYRSAFETYTFGYKKVIHGIELLRKSAEATLPIFDQAATELAEDGLFDKAQDIASWMNSLLPTSPLGYLRAAELYEAQGMTKKSLEVYVQGISYVSVENQDLFTERITGIQQRIDLMPNCDFIVHMPLEITCQIVQYLTICDLIEYSKVSKSWKKRIMQCPEAWCTLDVKDSGGDINITAIQDIKQFVRKVTMKSALANPLLVEDLLTSIGNGEFKNLAYLCLDGGSTTLEHIPHLLKGFDCVNLTCLDVTFSFPNARSCIPLGRVLRSCIHLKRLAYYVGDYLGLDDRELLLKEPTKITHLSIGGFPISETSVGSPNFFVPLIQFFPHLVSLFITAHAPGDLQIFTQRCSDIRRRAESPDFTDSAGTAKGLQYLRINGYIDPIYVTDYIAQKSETLISVDVSLEHLDDDGDYRLINPRWNWEHIPRLDCPLLKELHFSIDYYWPFEQWIGDCPELESIKLEGATCMTDSIFDVFKSLPKLRSLDLEDCQLLTDSGFSTFFNGMQGSQLHTVAIRFGDLLSTKALLSLVALQSLQTLSIHSCAGVTEAVFQDFAARSGINNSIEFVSLRSLNNVTDQPLLQLIHALPRLKQLNLSYMGNITDNSLCRIADLAPSSNLLKLNVYSCCRITPHAINSTKALLNVTQEFIK